MQDFDLFWQLATGRWVVQHHRFFSTDVFSYTASGQPWIYPAGSGVIFYLTHLAGGYALVTWLGALTSAGTIALLLRKNRSEASALALVAAPLIANRTQPRAEMFTTILFAAFLALLWSHYRGRQVRLWLLPLLMLLWVNLHPGFVAGIALSIAYVVLELLQFPVGATRLEAIARLRRAWPWLAATAASTLVNPWGPLIYVTLIRQQRAQVLHAAWVAEWQGVPLSWASLHQAMDWRDPQSSFWWLLAVAVVGVCIALWQKQWGAALILAGAGYLGIEHVRLQALFACVVVVPGGSLIDALRVAAKPKPVKNSRRQLSGRRIQATTAAALVVAGLLVLLTGIRAADLISNRYSMRSSQLATFGAGLSWWYPERAVEFIAREKLPGNVFNGYALGGYFTWRLFPVYRDYIDSRALPFGPELFFRAYDLATEAPNSPAWQQEADARGINTILVPLSRYQGMTLFPHLTDFCDSKSWRTVYLDEVSAIFVRVMPQTASWTDRLHVDCDKVSFSPPAARSRLETFNFSANAGGVLYSLERYPEALEHLDRAQAIFPDNASVHLFRGLVLQETGRNADAESEFRASLNLEPSDEAWFDLGLFYMTQRRYGDAVEVFRQSAQTSSRPHEMWMMLGQAYLGMRQPQPALEAFDKAVESSPFRGEGESLGAIFNSLIATGRAKAWFQLGDVAQAVSFQEEAVRLAPQDAKLWLGLANLYEVQGQISKAAGARMRGQALGYH